MSPTYNTENRRGRAESISLHNDDDDDDDDVDDVRWGGAVA